MRYKNKEKLTKEELEIHNNHCCYIKKCGYRCQYCDDYVSPYDFDKSK